MAEMKCYPQMNSLRATQEWSAARRESLEIITSGLMDIQHSDAVYYPMAMRRAEASDLETLRNHVVMVAEQYGFPEAITRRRNIDFDRKIASVLYEEMNIIPADAASSGVWNFLNIRVLLDVLIWRWGTWNSESQGWIVSPDRLFQFQRTAFGRLWWRAHLVGLEAINLLGEDQVVQLVERPRITGYRPLARAVAQRLINDRSGQNRDDLLRVVMKRLGRRLAVTNVHGMRQGQLDYFVEEVFAESATALRSLP